MQLKILIVQIEIVANNYHPGAVIEYLVERFLLAATLVLPGQKLRKNPGEKQLKLPSQFEFFWWLFCERLLEFY